MFRQVGFQSILTKFLPTSIRADIYLTYLVNHLIVSYFAQQNPISEGRTNFLSEDVVNPRSHATMFWCICYEMTFYTKILKTNATLKNDVSLCSQYFFRWWHGICMDT